MGNDSNDHDRPSAHDRAKGLVLMIMMNFHFPVTYCLLHTSAGNEVLCGVKNGEPTSDDRPGEWRLVGSGVSRMSTGHYTFYARTFGPGEAVRFDFGRETDGETRGPLEAGDSRSTSARTDPFRRLRRA